MKQALITLLMLGLIRCGFAQSEVKTVTNQLDINAGAGSFRGTVNIGAFRTWKVGKNKKFGIGAGVRLTSFLGANLYYITAPARLTSESTSPLILFSDIIEENIDSLLIKSPQINSLNLAINLDYQISPKITIGFNIDAIGFSFGKKVTGNYINGFEGANVEASPTAFNILLISDNDRGSLNSELYVKYSLNDKWGLKAGGQFLFSEYTTSVEVQQFPEPNDRFRNKSLLFTAGVTLKL